MSTAQLPAVRPSELGKPIYVGSVQHLYAVPGRDDLMVCETTNAGSVFDVGSIFDIPGSDVSRATFRHALYTRMGRPGDLGQGARCHPHRRQPARFVQGRHPARPAGSDASLRRPHPSCRHARRRQRRDLPGRRSGPSEHVQCRAAVPRDETGSEAVSRRVCL